MPTGKIGVHTRFFEYANFRLPLSTFLVNVLKHYRIHISQLSVIGTAKVSHFEILCRVHGFEPTVGLFHSLKSWNDRFFWVDAFACPASFTWNTSKSVSKDPFPKSYDFSAEHYVTLVAYPAPFHKYPKHFLCLIGISRNYTLDEDTYPQFLRDNDEEMDLLSFIQTVNPTKVRVGERQRAEGEPKLLDTTVGHVVPLLPVAPACASSELEASVDKLFDEGGSGGQAEQGDYASGGHGVGIPQVSEAAKTVAEDAAPMQPKRQRKRKTIVFYAGGPSHPPKKLREDHRTSTGSSVAGANIAEAEVDSFARPSIPLIIVATTITSTVDPATTVKEKFVESSVFGGDSPSGWADHTVDDGCTCHEMVDEFAPPKFFASIRRMEHDQLFTEFNARAARQMSLSAEVRMRAEYNIREMMRLNSVVEEKSSLLKARDAEIESLKAQLLVKETEAAEAIRLHAEASKFVVVETSLRDEVTVLKEQNAALEQEKTDLGVRVADLAASVKVREQEVADLYAQVYELETSSAGLQEKIAAYENFIDQLEKFQDKNMGEVNEKFDKLCADFVEMAIHLEEKFYPHLLTTISGVGGYLPMAWNLPSPNEGLSARITHGAEGRKLTDVAAYNPSAETDYLSALQRLQSVNFSLIAELRSHKDASVDTIMNLLRLDDTLAERLGLTESQPHVNQLMIHIHHSPDQRVIGASALSLSLDPLSAMVLEGTEGTSGAAPDTTTALSVTFVSASTIPPISTDDYEVAHADGQESGGADGQAVVDENVNPFPNIDDAELDVPE
ncbi:hypothetical protein Tco_0806243 [Tanacetum coccineum]